MVARHTMSSSSDATGFMLPALAAFAPTRAELFATCTASAVPPPMMIASNATTHDGMSTMTAAEISMPAAVRTGV